MIARSSIDPEIQKPRPLTDKEWQELLIAARSSWLRYIFRPNWQFCTSIAIILLIFISGFFSRGGIHAASKDISEMLVVLFYFFIFFRLICGSIDWFGKRKLARQIHLIYRR